MVYFLPIIISSPVGKAAALRTACSATINIGMCNQRTLTKLPVPVIPISEVLYQKYVDVKLSKKKKQSFRTFLQAFLVYSRISVKDFTVGLLLIIILLINYKLIPMLIH